MFNEYIAQEHFKQNLQSWIQTGLIFQLGSSYMINYSEPLKQASVRIVRNKMAELEYSIYFGITDKNGYVPVVHDSEKEVKELLDGNIPDFMQEHIKGYPENILDIKNIIENSEERFLTYSVFSKNGITENFKLGVYEDTSDYYITVESVDFMFFNIVRVMHHIEELEEFLMNCREMSKDDRVDKLKQIMKSEMIKGA